VAALAPVGAIRATAVASRAAAVETRVGICFVPAP
jgi:hypothetical protein